MYFHFIIIYSSACYSSFDSLLSPITFAAAAASFPHSDQYGFISFTSSIPLLDILISSLSFLGPASYLQLQSKVNNSSHSYCLPSDNNWYVFFNDTDCKLAQTEACRRRPHAPRWLRLTPLSLATAPSPD